MFGVKEIGDRARVFEKVAEGLESFVEIEFAYCFGSFIQGETFNDIDIALHLSTDMSSYQELKFASRVGRELEKVLGYEFEFDVKILNRAPLNFQYRVIDTGKLIFCRDEVKRIRYEAHMLSKYLDYKVTSDWLDRKFLARV